MARGTLRVYLGAAPGVGKTFKMLEEGHRRAARGTDVVIGLVEAHGRPSTEALVEGLELVPRKEMEYRGTSFTEMDLDALLARRPQVALVDEMAHTNVPGSRNIKRWQDITELLDAGVNVITTVNIQHLESLNDVVEQITGIVQLHADVLFVVGVVGRRLPRRIVHGHGLFDDLLDVGMLRRRGVACLTGNQSTGYRSSEPPRSRNVSHVFAGPPSTYIANS